MEDKEIELFSVKDCGKTSTNEPSHYFIRPADNRCYSDDHQLAYAGIKPVFRSHSKGPLQQPFLLKFFYQRYSRTLDR